MQTNYPQNCVWYIEARPWNGPYPPRGDPGYAPVEAASRGSAVLVTFTTTEADGSRALRSYLLTSAHVVRDAEDNLLLDIVCYPPRSGYVRTKPNSRRSGTFPDAEAQPAQVSACSPCGGQPKPRPMELRQDPASDWVLLKIAAPGFHHRPSVRAWGDGQAGDGPFTVVGYPYGAGTLKERDDWVQSGKPEGDYPFWRDGQPIVETSAKEFRVAEVVTPGILAYEGPEETRPGMSGGGIFTEAGALAGLHRSSTDATMRRGAVRATVIERYLREVHRMELSAPAPAPARGLPRAARVGVGLGGAALLALLIWLLIPPAPPLQTFELTVHAKHDDPRNGVTRVKGLRIGFEAVSTPGQARDAETDERGTAVLRFTPSQPVAPGEQVLGFLICRNEPEGVAEEGPLILVEHGRFPDRITKEDPIVLNRGAVTCFVKGRTRYLGNLLVDAIPEAVGETPVPNPPEQDVNGVIRRAAALAALPADMLATATQGWVEELKAERPVLALADLDSELPMFAAGLRQIAESVGRLQVGSVTTYSGTAFLISSRLALVPHVALLGEADARKMRIQFVGANDLEAHDVLRIVWRDKALASALLEIAPTRRRPLKLGTAADRGALAEREIAVLGFPHTDERLPLELNSLFTQDGQRLAIMPGRTFSAEAPWAEVEFQHDATTSAGTGGGPVVDLRSMCVIALHGGGRFTGARMQNYVIALTGVLASEEFKRAVEPLGGVTVETLSPPGDDALHGPGGPRFAIAYDATFLGCAVPMPSLPASFTGDPASAVVLDYINYSLRMNPERRIPFFVALNVDRTLAKDVRRGRDVWYLDPRIKPESQVGAEVYKQNDYDLGHLAQRRAVAWGATYGAAERASKSVYYFTNATPQHKEFNRGGWAMLEEKVYRGLQPASKRLSVLAGPVFEANDVEERGTRVPRRFWMIGVYENPENANKPFVHAFIAEQYRIDSTGDPRFLSKSENGARETTVEEIQAATGLRFSIPR